MLIYLIQKKENYMKWKIELNLSYIKMEIKINFCR